MCLRTALAAVGAAAISVSSGVASAQDHTQFDLVWHAPAECPDAGAVRHDVDRALGGRHTVARAADLHVRAVVTPAAAGMSLRLETAQGGEAGVRVLTAPACAELAEATAIIVALMIDPAAVAETAAREPAPASPALLAHAVAPSGPTAMASAIDRAIELSAPPPSDRRDPGDRSHASERAPIATGDDAALPVRFHAALALAGDVGALPGASAGLALSAGAALGIARLELAGTWLPSRRAHVEGSSQIGGDFALLAVAARGCADVLRGDVEVGPCAELEIGRMTGEGFGVSSPGAGESLWVAAGGGARVALPIGEHVALRLDVGARAPMVRPTFVLENVGPVHQAGAIEGRAALGAELRF